MSRHWNPDGETARYAGADEPSQPARAPWPEGATVGLAMIAASCLAIGAILYQVAGPRDVIEESVAVREAAVTE